MAENANFKYECQVCDIKRFKSRADWLTHMLLERHSLEARVQIQQLYLESDGNMLVVSEIGQVENSQVLEYVSRRLPSFSNFFSFRPEANIFIVVCSEGSDFEWFTAVPHVIGGIQPNFREYSRIPTTEWKSYFIWNQDETTTRRRYPVGEDHSDSAKSCSSGISFFSQSHVNAQVKKEPGLVRQDEVAIAGTSGVNRDSTKRKARYDYGSNVKSGNANAGCHNYEDNLKSRRHSMHSNWSDEMTYLTESVMMPQMEINARKAAIAELRTLLRPNFPSCELINVGGDFLGFNLDKDELNIFFDWEGVINPENAARRNFVTVVTQDENFIRNLQNTVFQLLKAGEASSSIKAVWYDGPVVKFSRYAFPFPLKCSLMFKPFKMAQTAILCKQLFSMSPLPMTILKMVVYWAMKHGFEGRVFRYPYPIYWLVYFYLMRGKELPAAIQLQKSCTYVITDEGINVGFTYDARLLNEIPVTVSTNNPIATTTHGPTGPRSEIEWVQKWFEYLSETLGDVTEGGNFTSKFIVCPRARELICKTKFKRCKEYVEKVSTRKAEGMPRWYKGKKENWANVLFSLGFDDNEHTLEKMRRLQLPADATMFIQHPFYIYDNLSLAFDRDFSKHFFGVIRQTMEKLTLLLDHGELNGSLLEALSV